MMFTDAYPKTVKLRDGREVAIRVLASDDFDKLHTFFLSVPVEDRLFLRDDVSDPELIRKWTDRIDLKRVIPLVAVDGDKFVADGTLHLDPHGWARHVGHVRLVTARTHRSQGLGAFLLRELVSVASEIGLEKLQAHVIEDDEGSVRLFEAAGFNRQAVLKGMVRDRNGEPRDLLTMINDVENLGRIMEDWIHDSMVPAYRSPGEG